MKRVQYPLLIVLNAFLAVTAVVGGIGILTGGIALDPGLLQGSPFSTYTIPGLALLVLVGGGALLTTGLLLRHARWGVRASGITALMILVFESVEVLVIGSPPGIARNLQLFYIVLGLLIGLLSVASWSAD